MFNKKEYIKKWRNTTKKGKEYRKRNKCSPKGRATNKRWRDKLKLETIQHYGGKCTCCGEDKLIFLTIDHINGGGNKHRRELNKKGQDFYSWLRLNNWLKGYRVLCHNCNFAHSALGYCPHKDK
jgi:hypothetical protein